MWNGIGTPKLFIPSIVALNNTVTKSKVNGVFISSEKILGQPVKGERYHISAILKPDMVYTPKLNTANQMMAEKLEDFRILNSGLSEYPIDAIKQAITLLKTDSLYRSEKCLGVAEWLKNLHEKCAKSNSYNRTNIIWLAVATAPIGYCHVKSTMIGTLLDDIISELTFDCISRRFAEKMHPLQYQRPQAPPSEGNIKEAEEIIEKLGVQNSFKRRFARFEELKKIWKSKENEKGKGFFLM